MSDALTKQTVEEGTAPEEPKCIVCEEVKNIPHHILRRSPFKCPRCNSSWSYCPASAGSRANGMDDGYWVKITMTVISGSFHVDYE